MVSQLEYYVVNNFKSSPFLINQYIKLDEQCVNLREAIEKSYDTERNKAAFREKLEEVCNSYPESLRMINSYSRREEQRPAPEGEDDYEYEKRFNNPVLSSREMFELKRQLSLDAIVLSAKLKQLRSYLVARFRSKGYMDAYYLLTNKRFANPSRILPIRYRQDIRRSRTRTALEICKIRSSAELGELDARVGIAERSLYDTKVSYYASTPTSITDSNFTGSKFDLSRPFQTWFGTEQPSAPNVLKRKNVSVHVKLKVADSGGISWDHAIGGILIQKFDKLFYFVFNGYMLPTEVYLALKEVQLPREGKIYVFPNDFYRRSDLMEEAEYEYLLQHEREWKSEGECSEFAILLPMVAAKAQVFTVQSAETEAQWTAGVFANIKALYDSWVPFTLAKYNDLRRSTGLL